MKNFIVFIDRFTLNKPNGEIISTFHLISSLEKFSTTIVTSETDYKSPNVQFLLKKKILILYIYQIFLFMKNLNEHSIIFINSIYSIKSFMIPILISKFFSKKDFKIIISPRGMLSDKATRSLKKRFYLKFINIFLKNKFVIQVSNNMELNDVKNNLNPNCKIIVSSDPIPKPPKFEYYPQLDKNSLKIVYFGRLSPIKNVLFAYSVFKKMHQKIVFDVYGEITSTDEYYFDKCNTLLKSISSLNYKYKGFATYKDRLDILKKYDICFVPSFSENFCHTIYDALSVGTPVLCSDGVPWSEINTFKAGKLIPLEQIDEFVNFLHSYIKMNHNEIIQIRKNAYNCSLEKFKNAKLDLDNLIHSL